MDKISSSKRRKFALARYGEHFLNIPIDRATLAAAMMTELRGQPKGKKLEIDEFRDVSKEEFIRDCICQGKPAVLRGFAKEWTCVKLWSPEFFAEKFGDDDIEVTDNVNDGGIFNVETLKLREFMRLISEGDQRKYLRFGNLLHRYPELINDFDHRLIKEFMGPLRIGNNAGVFIGAKGTKTTLHAAPPHNFFVQVHGVKRWIIMPASSDPLLLPNVDKTTYYSTNYDPLQPDFSTYPTAEYVDYYDFDLEPGDVLYNPPSFWHHVSNKTSTIGVGFRWASPKCFELNWSQMMLFFFATNPSLFFVMRNKKNYTNVLKEAEKFNRERLKKGA